MGDEVISPGVDVTDRPAVGAALEEARPDAVYHLAAISIPRQAQADADAAMSVNVGGTRNVLEAAMELPVKPTVLVTSSAAVYAPANHPITEESPTRASTVYVESKLAAEAACAEVGGNRLKVIVVRPFNHTGPGQAPDLAVPAFAQSIAKATKTGLGYIQTGNLDVRRDVGDVRDVVRAYRLAVEHLAAGTYNVCTGKAVLLRDIARHLAELAGRPDLEFRTDPERVRKGEPPLMVGDASKLAAATGWAPEIELDTTLADLFAWWAARS